MSYFPVVRALREFGPKETFRKMLLLKTIKFGTLMGVDEFGNKYYENAKDYPAGQHRWFEPPGMRHAQTVDGSEVPADWHGWLHNVTDEPPSETGVGDVGKFRPIMNAKGGHNPYPRNHGGVVAKYTPNLSLARPRGYGVGNGLSKHSPLRSLPHEELFYTQPGNPLDPRHRHPRESPGYTLLDTPDDVKARLAAKITSGSAAALAEAVRRFEIETSEAAEARGERSRPTPTFALSDADRREVEEDVAGDLLEFHEEGLGARDIETLKFQLEEVEAIIARCEALAGFNDDADDGLAEARERRDALEADLATAMAAA